MLDDYKTNSRCNVKDAIEILDKNENHVVFVVDDNNILLGLFTPGDMRKYILRSTDLSQVIETAMNRNPIVFPTLMAAQKAKEKKKMAVYPVVNSGGQLIDALFERAPKKNEVVSDGLGEIPLVIMAGGKGTRLYPYTKVLPKALIPIGDYTISERIINNFYKYGCRTVYFILNYKANMIKAYFNDIQKPYKVNYIQEDTFLGTGGGLSLLKNQINTTFALSNCDILVNDDLECIYKTHKKSGNKITFVCAMKNVIIPYGIVKANAIGGITEIAEKPEISFLTNTGVYFIEPEVIDELTEYEFIHLPDIAKKYMLKGDRVGVFPISEKAWLDMGQFNEMEYMIKAVEENGGAE